MKLGFSVNDYNEYLRYINTLNTDNKKPAITLPENSFLISFINYKNGKLYLDITCEKALKAGAILDGYQLTVILSRRL